MITLTRFLGILQASVICSFGYRLSQFYVENGYFHDRCYLLTCTYVCIHTEWVELASQIEYITSWTQGIPGLTVPCYLTRNFHPVLPPLCVAEYSWSGVEFQVCLDRGCPHHQQPSSSPASCARWCDQKKVLDQLTVETSCTTTKPAESSLHETKEMLVTNSSFL